MDPFYSTSGSSPPEGRRDHPAGHDLRREEQESPSPLPEELVEALAGLLAQALINDIRQYPDLPPLTLPALPLPLELGRDTLPAVKRKRHIQVRRLAHAP